MSSIQLLQGDCLDVLPTISSGSVDAIITDLPYGTTACAWDEVIPFIPMWEQVRRVLKPGGVFVSTASQPFTSKLIMSNLDWFRYCYVWEKNTGTRFLDAGSRPLLFHEDIAVFYESQPTYNPQKTPGPKNHGRVPSDSPSTEIYKRHGRPASDVSGMKYPKTVVKFATPPPSKKTDHPTEKPVALYEYLIRTYTNPGETVLDIAAGSGTTGVAAVRSGRDAILIEKKPEYFRLMENQIALAKSQPFLLDPALLA